MLFTEPDKRIRSPTHTTKESIHALSEEEPHRLAQVCKLVVLQDPPLYHAADALLQVELHGEREVAAHFSVSLHAAAKRPKRAHFEAGIAVRRALTNERRGRLDCVRVVVPVAQSPRAERAGVVCARRAVRMAALHHKRLYCAPPRETPRVWRETSKLERKLRMDGRFTRARRENFERRDAEVLVREL